MSNYIENERSCRVDFFKESGKWYTTEAIIFQDYNGELFKEFRKALYADDHVRGAYHGMRAVCLEPYSKYSHPISIIWDGVNHERPRPDEA